MKQLVVFDFFAGTKSATDAFRVAGHTVITFELNASFQPDHVVDIMDLNAVDLVAQYGTPDFVWASPPCTAFSVASIGHHWASGGQHPMPKTEAAVYNQELVWKTRRLIEEMQPTYGFLIENPRGMLRKLPPVSGLQRRTVTYCQYGDTRMKPTDLWGTVAGWTPRPPCKNGLPCHVAAPAGSRTGTQGLAGSIERSRVPYELGVEIMAAIRAHELSELKGDNRSDDAVGVGR